MKSVLAIMQPTFLPWAGYFNLMAESVDFVFLDDVQLEKQSWQTRNKLLINQRTHWISVPISHSSLTQRINETELVDSPHWKNKLSKLFAYNYGKHPHYHEAQEVINLLIKNNYRYLSDLNESIIRFIAHKLDINPNIHRSSELGIALPRTERLVALCSQFKAKIYLSPRGSSDYLLEDNFEEKTPAKLAFQDFQPGPYPQHGSNTFVSHLSIVDIIANLGWEGTSQYVRRGKI